MLLAGPALPAVSATMEELGFPLSASLPDVRFVSKGLSLWVYSVCSKGLRFTQTQVLRRRGLLHMQHLPELVNTALNPDS